MDRNGWISYVSRSKSYRYNGDFFMSGVPKRPICGSKTSTQVHGKKLLKRLKSTLSYGDQRLYATRSFQEGDNKSEEYFCYNDLEEVSEDEGNTRSGKWSMITNGK